MPAADDSCDAKAWRQRLGFAAPMVPMAALHAPMLATIPALYAKYSSIGLTEIAAGLLALRVLDFLLDPLIGFASDRTPDVWGRRKLWVMAGLVLAAPTTYFFLRPGPHTGFAYFLFWAAAASLSWALVDIAHGAWVADLSDDDDGRTTLAFWRTEALYLGGIGFAAAPLLPFLHSTGITPESLAAGSWGIIAGLVIAMAAMLGWAPTGRSDPRRQRPSHRGVWRAIADNAPARLLVLQVLSSSLASGMVAALFLFFVDSYLGLLNQLVYVTLGAYAVGMAAAPLWPPVIRWLGRSRVQAASLGVTSLTVIAMACLPRGNTGFFWLAGLFAISAALTVGRELNIVTMVADAADDEELTSHVNKTGFFFAAVTIAQKAGYALGGASSLLIASELGFDPKARAGASVMEGFFLPFTVLPFLLYVGAALLAARFQARPVRHAVRT